MKHSVLITKKTGYDLFDVIVEASEGNHRSTSEYRNKSELWIQDLLLGFKQDIHHRLFELVAVGSSYFDTDY